MAESGGGEKSNVYQNLWVSAGADPVDRPEAEFRSYSPTIQIQPSRQVDRSRWNDKKEIRRSERESYNPVSKSRGRHVDVYLKSFFGERFEPNRKLRVALATRRLRAV